MEGSMLSFCFLWFVLVWAICWKWKALYVELLLSKAVIARVLFSQLWCDWVRSILLSSEAHTRRQRPHRHRDSASSPLKVELLLSKCCFLVWAICWKMEGSKMSYCSSRFYYSLSYRLNNWRLHVELLLFKCCWVWAIGWTMEGSMLSYCSLSVF